MMKTPLLMVIYWLFILGILLQGTLALVALVLAYSYISDANKNEKTHFTYQIRSFWLFIVYWAVATAFVLGATSLMGLRGNELFGLVQGMFWFRLFFMPSFYGNILLNGLYPTSALVVMAVPYILLLLWIFGRFIKGVRLLLRKKPIPNPQTAFI